MPAVFRTLDVMTTHRYPWRELDVGDRFVFPREIGMQSARVMSGAASRRIGVVLKVVKVSGRIYCYRIAGGSGAWKVKVGRPAKYPWKTMKVGETFKFDRPSLRSACTRVSQMNDETGKVFNAISTRKGVICKRVK